MSWLDALLYRGNEAKQTVPERVQPPERTRSNVRPQVTRLAPPAPEPPPTIPPKDEIKTVWFQIRAPMNGDAGAVEPAFYSVTDGLLTMHDKDGKPGKRQALGPEEDPGRIASRLAKEAWVKTRGSDFNRPLRYPPSGVA